MRLTLLEVVGQELYDLPWLRRRVLWHLDPNCCTGEIFVAEADSGEIQGHTIVRLDRDPEWGECGLFSTTYVAPEHRRLGLARQLIHSGEDWLRQHRQSCAVTDTALDNQRLRRLFASFGYTELRSAGEMVRLGRRFQPPEGCSNSS